MPIPFILMGIAVATGVAGVASGAAGAKQMYDANEIIDESKLKYGRTKKELDQLELSAKKSLDKLGQLKLDTWKSFDRFIVTFEKIKNKPVIGEFDNKDKFNLSKQELNEIKGVNITAIDILGTGALSAGAGALAGIAAYGGTMTLGVASTGTAIASLSGAAATNATLAALGGGSLASGGLGIAGGTAVLGGLVAGPVLAVGGILLAIKGNSSMEKALQVKKDVNDAVKFMNDAMPLLKKLKSACDKMYSELTNVYGIYMNHIINLEMVVNSNSDYNYFSHEDKKLLQNTVLLVKLLKNLTTVDILIKNKDKQVINEAKVTEIIGISKTTREDLYRSA
ncbi:hypothetical protein ACUH7Y_25825 [Clostridium beijerinckii]|jgi:hypothetical protein|uniref:Chemotaxis protein n=1 Tax=Clostridium beijerinckii TaxID=1520 RepID=A0A7X9XRZ2_CLOBE|nr:chemotaxis protein [Clostridium beijerinckii]NMF07953.1 chemotaxis protein [Clostridium beijerinckii]